MKSKYKQELKDIALNSVKGAMPSDVITQDESKGSIVVNTFLKTGDSIHKVHIYARLETDKRDGAFLILVDPSVELEGSALKTVGHWKGTFDKVYKGKCYYAAMYDFGLDFQSHREFCTLLHEYSEI